MPSKSDRARLKHTCQVNYYLRASKPLAELTSVRCFVSYGGQRIFIQNVGEIEPRYWNAKSKRPRTTVAFEGSSLHKRLDNVEDWLSKYFEKYVADHADFPEPNAFKNQCEILIRNGGKIQKDAQKTSFFDFVEKAINETKDGTRLLLRGPRAGQSYAPDTHKSYTSTLNLIKRFAVSLGKKEFGFNDIDLDWYENFKSYAFNVEGLSSNYFGTIVKNIKSFLNEGMEKGLHTNSKHKSKHFIKTQSEADTIYLDPKKLQILFDLDLSNNLRLEAVRDLFLVGCWTGLRFSDFNNISASNIHQDTLEIKTQKTGESVAIPIHDNVKRIMDRYSGKTQNSLPPSISNQKLNDYLKELCDQKAKFHELVDITLNKGGKKVIVTRTFYELVTTHTARRSFASNMFRMGVPSLVIMAITGHRTEKAFLKYIKITSKEKAEMLREIWNRQLMKAVIQ